jgi:hypothetical protein
MKMGRRRRIGGQHQLPQPAPPLHPALTLLCTLLHPRRVLMMKPMISSYVVELEAEAVAALAVNLRLEAVAAVVPPSEGRPRVQ